MSEMKDGTTLIAKERLRQIEEEGWTPEHDDEDIEAGDLCCAAICYAAPQAVYFKDSSRGQITFHDPWPEDWDEEWDKRDKHGPIRRLVIAGALIAAEIDRIQRESQ